ncbi:hypothetical protein KDK_78460 [Dictyobacter kobayashii]|uniref:Uncharacterized protein n=1 Tax=Dictyobacter kobayashii TaxID=2014872 RepID=A0A402AY53_9CHLR|nr:hypothetical protein KDK_78460 [Dictyobacter kobayashii]
MRKTLRQKWQPRFALMICAVLLALIAQVLMTSATSTRAAVQQPHTIPIQGHVLPRLMA